MARMKALTLTQLQYVVEVARSGHFGQAAKRCFVTQPTLSMQIQKLEEELGVVLFDRNKKPIAPTPMGHKIVAIAQNILNGVGQIEETIRGVKGEIKGEFSLGIIPTLSPYLLPRFLHPFLEKYPTVELTVEELQTDEIIRRLRDNSLDAGLLAIPLNARGIVEHSLFKEPFVAYLSADHPLAKYKTLTEKQLTEKDLWILNEGHCFRDQVLALCKMKNKRGQGQHIHFESGNIETLKRLVDRKSGYTLMPYLAVVDLPQRDRDRAVRAFVEPIPSRDVGLVYTPGLVKTAVLQALRAEVEASVPTELLEKGRRHVLPVR